MMAPIETALETNDAGNFKASESLLPYMKKGKDL